MKVNTRFHSRMGGNNDYFNEEYGDSFLQIASRDLKKGKTFNKIEFSHPTSDFDPLPTKKHMPNSTKFLIIILIVVVAAIWVQICTLHH